MKKRGVLRGVKCGFVPFRAHLYDGGYVDGSVEPHKVERQPLELVGPVLVLLDMLLQVQAGWGRSMGGRDGRRDERGMRGLK